MGHKASEEIQRGLWVAPCLLCEPPLLFTLPLLTSGKGCWKGLERGM